MLGLITAEAPNASQSYGGLIISGVITIILALIGAYANRTLRARNSGGTPSTQPVLLPGDEPKWARELREAVVKENTELKVRVRFLERVCAVYDIDPDTGRRLPTPSEAFAEVRPDAPANPSEDESTT